MEKIRRDMLESFELSYSQHRKKYYGYGSVNDKNFEIKVKTKYYDTPEEALVELKEKIVKAYIKIEK